MKKSILLPSSPVCAVRADTSIADCVRLMRDKSIGALVITSANVKEEIVGMFTERDLIKQIELIHKGGFWDNPVRSVMTSTVRTVSVDKLEEAPKIMARYNIRHLPIVSEEKGHPRLVGVISMRDLFRTVMEKFDYDFDKIFPAPSPSATPARKPSRPKQKLVGVFSEDPSLRALVDKAAKFTGHLLVKALTLKSEFNALDDVLAKFETLFIDLDGMSVTNRAELLAQLKGLSPKRSIFIAFSPLLVDESTKLQLRKLHDNHQVHLFSKPLAFGLFFEKFLREI